MLRYVLKAVDQMTEASQATKHPEQLHLTSVEIEQLHRFHSIHFKDPRIPRIGRASGTTGDWHNDYKTTDDDFGHYDDGVRRTLSTAQVKMFRHSEIHRLLQARRQQREREQEEARQRNKREQRRQAERRHYDQPDHNNVETLTYDDVEPQAVSEDAAHTNSPRHFLWPKLER